jgi:hypothetical protein
LKRLRFLLAAMLFLLFSIAGIAQKQLITASGVVKENAVKSVLPFVSVVLKSSRDSSFVVGTITNEEGRFTLTDIKPGAYYLEFSTTGYAAKKLPVVIGELSAFLDLGPG